MDNVHYSISEPVYSEIITDKFKFENPHTKAYYYILNSSTCEVYIMIPTTDDEIVEVVYELFDRLGIDSHDVDNDIEGNIRRCINGDTEFALRALSPTGYIIQYNVVCGDRGQGIYFNIRDCRY